MLEHHNRNILVIVNKSRLFKSFCLIAEELMLMFLVTVKTWTRLIKRPQKLLIQHIRLQINRHYCLAWSPSPFAVTAAN